MKGSLLDLIDSRIGRLAVPDVYAHLTDSLIHSTDRMVYSFADVSLGPAHPSRQIILGIILVGREGPASVTLEVGGDPPLALERMASNGVSTDSITFWRASGANIPVAEGSLGNLIVDCGGVTSSRCAVFVFSVINRLRLDEDASAGDGSSTYGATRDVALKADSGAAVLAISYFAPGGAPSYVSAGVRLLTAADPIHAILGTVDGSGGYTWAGVDAGPTLIAATGNISARHRLFAVSLR